MINQVVVIGGGVIGLACALRLRETGVEVLLLDAGGPSAPASLGNAGHIAIEQTRPLASPESVRSAPGRLFAFGGALDFRLSDIGAWGRWAPQYLASSTGRKAEAGSQVLGALLASAMPAWRRLASDLGAPDLLIEDGHLIAWETLASTRAGLARWLTAPTGEAVVQTMTTDQIQDLASDLCPRIVGAAKITNTGQISDPALLMQALDRRFCNLGGRRCAARVASVKAAAHGVDAVLATGEIVNGERMVIAAGVGSRPLLAELGYDAPVIAERGYHIEGMLEEHEAHWRGSPPVVFEDRSLIVTRFGDRLRASSFVEFGREDSPPDGRKWARLKRHCRELGLPMREPFTQWMGARPTLPDYLPAIGMGEGGLIYAFGHQHLGLTLAAVTGELVRDLALGRGGAIGLQPFDLRRFHRRRPNPSEYRG